MTLLDLFDLAAQREASDIHLATGETARLRIKGELVALDEPLDLAILLEPVITPEGRARLTARTPYERTILHGHNDLAFHGLVFRIGEDGLGATFRIIAKGVPSFERITEGAEAFFRGLVERRRGLVLVVGPTGSGKWTTVSTLVDTINAERPVRIFVATTHPSYLFESKLGMVTQLHIGQDCESYERAMELVHGADLDVLALEDIPTVEALRQALSLAEIGHLVFANLHATTPIEAIERLLESAGDEAPALRRALAENLVAVTAQRLLPSADVTRRVPAYEWIANSPRVKEALLGGDLVKAQREDPECRTLEAALELLAHAGKIAP